MVSSTSILTAAAVVLAFAGAVPVDLARRDGLPRFIQKGVLAKITLCVYESSDCTGPTTTQECRDSTILKYDDGLSDPVGWSSFQFFGRDLMDTESIIFNQQRTGDFKFQTGRFPAGPNSCNFITSDMRSDNGRATNVTIGVNNPAVSFGD